MLIYSPRSALPGILLLFLLLHVFIAAIGQRQPEDSIARVGQNRNLSFLLTAAVAGRYHYEHPSNNRLNYRFTGDDFVVFLIKAKVKQKARPQFLCIDNTSIDSVLIYQLELNGNYRQIYKGGNLVVYNQKQVYQWHTALIEPGRPLLVAMKSGYKNINISYDVLSAELLQSKSESYRSIFFFYLGAVLLIMLVLVAAVSFFRQRNFTLYMGYIFCLTAWIAAHYGYLFPLLYPDLPQLNQVIKPLSTLGAAWFLLSLSSRLFSGSTHASERPGLSFHSAITSSVSSLVLHIIPPVMVLSLFLLVPTIPGWLFVSILLAWHIVLLTSILLIVAQPLLLFRHNITARIFLVAMCVICFMAVVQLFTILGLIHNWYISEHGMTVASIVELSIMSFGVFYSQFQRAREKDKMLSVLKQEKAETLQRLITVQEDERKRIANDLHDNIGPLLAALKINFRRIVTIRDPSVQQALAQKTENIIDDSIQEIRGVAHNLMPKGLSSKGLIFSLMEYFDGIQQLYYKAIIFTHHVDFAVEPSLQVNIYRIVCELVLNAAKHSDAKMINIMLKSDNSEVSISIKDDGQGFDLSSNAGPKSLGLQSVESRVQYSKGQFALKTGRGKGTEIDIKVPL